MRWDIYGKLTKKQPTKRLDEILEIVLSKRNIVTDQDKEAFLNPPNPSSLTIKQVGIDEVEAQKAIKRIKRAIDEKETIVVFGDYDADGVTATAILWETLYLLGAQAYPFIPSRLEHGYGLSESGIDEVVDKRNPSLIITVDNGIVAHEAALYCKEKAIDLIITDHHLAAETLPQCLALIHTTQLAGAGVAWVFSEYLLSQIKTEKKSSTLELAVIGTVADQVPLLNFNRSIVKWGLEALRKTSRAGLLELFSIAAVEPSSITTYHINYHIAPRINAMGRLESALDALRLLCTRDKNKAIALSETLHRTNIDRQDLTLELHNQALEMVASDQNKLLIIHHEDFHEGVIGLVAGKITEKYHRPAIVISRGETVCKASARSIKGVNIIELIRRHEHLLLNAGGHPMAAGFSIQTDRLEEFISASTADAQATIPEELLQPALSIECELEVSDISWELYEKVKALEPFGASNHPPIFCLKEAEIMDAFTIGRDKKHIKLLLPSKIKGQSVIPGLWFGKGEHLSRISNPCSLAFTLSENTWNGKTELQVLVKDVL